jgi:8-amino-7-oxononanoate synthase
MKREKTLLYAGLHQPTMKESRQMDIFDKTRAMDRAKEAKAMGIYPYFQPMEKSEGTIAYYDGREIIMLGSNNYLGLTMDPRVKQAAAEAVEKYGTSCTGSRYMNGTLEMHLRLDRRLAEFVGKEAALTFTTGYQTNMGTVTALCGKKDYLILDKEAHSCVIDGSLMALGTMRRFAHNNLEALDRMLGSLPEDAGALVVVDGIYSMAGEIAPIPEIVEVCKKHGARLMIDDAHGVGVLGGGRGAAWHFGLTDEVDLITGTFSKSFASVGGFVAGEADVIHYIQHNARTMIFSASMAPSSVAAVLTAVDIIEAEPERVEKLWENADYLREGLKSIGINIGKSNTPIIPIITDDDYRTVLAWRALMDEGVYTNTVVTPAAPRSMLRASVMATHTRDQLDRALAAIEKVGRNLDLMTEKEVAEVSDL